MHSSSYLVQWNTILKCSTHIIFVLQQEANSCSVSTNKSVETEQQFNLRDTRTYKYQEYNRTTFERHSRLNRDLRLQVLVNNTRIKKEYVQWMPGQMAMLLQ
jgi:hypothetical protein